MKRSNDFAGCLLFAVLAALIAVPFSNIWVLIAVVAGLMFAAPHFGGRR
jgi:hypothetical protein